MCFHFLPPLLYFPSSSKEDQVQLMLINFLHPHTPLHVHTKWKPPAWFMSSFTTVLTAILCPSRFHWGPANQPSLWQDRRDSLCLQGKLLELSYESLRVLVSDRDDSLDWDNVEWVLLPTHDASVPRILKLLASITLCKSTDFSLLQQHFF